MKVKLAKSAGQLLRWSQCGVEVHRAGCRFLMNHRVQEVLTLRTGPVLSFGLYLGAACAYVPLTFCALGLEVGVALSDELAGAGGAGC